MLTPFQLRASRALAGAPFFSELEVAEWRLVSRRAVREGELLFAKGEPSGHLFGVVGGRLKTFLTPAPDREITLELVAPGELLGVLGVVVGGPRHASVQALAHSEIAAVDRRSLEALWARRPELRTRTSAAAAEATGRLAQRAGDDAFMSVEERLEKVLEDLATRFGEAVDRGVSRCPSRSGTRTRSTPSSSSSSPSASWSS